ncbi:hypothetical protein [Brunnivagina elsteri]|uniref:Uncharacterized protein n=1 Tax=Brunnivagina elsteri CCALA 953 TaxID=987040 RepID=A0A2A2TE67_9CYAN|nr:hypothetical protein [Calothrix elsteri]PAX52013.1 hypothetical protein CK510_21660 [Calothrix elsteri CCALA 953]
METIAVNKTIAIQIGASNQGNRIVLFDNSLPSNIPSEGIISINGFLKNLKAYSKITSLASAPIPAIGLEDTDQERLIKIMDIEWNNPRIQVDLEISNDGSNYITLGSVSLINQAGYPFRNFSLLDFYTDGLAAELGSNGKIACSVKDVGYGKLASVDALTIYGSVTQEIVINDLLTNNEAIPTTKNLLAATNTLISNASNKAGLTIFNGSNEAVFIGYTATTNNTDYSIRLSSGKGYEFPVPVYSGNIYAYSVNASTIQITEFRSV